MNIGRNGQTITRSHWQLCGALLLSVFACGCQVAATAQNVQGVSDYQRGQYPSAVQRFQKAIQTDRYNADAYYNLASTYHRMASEQSQRAGSEAEREAVKDLQIQAETLYNNCLDVNENHVECHRGLAVLLVEMGRTDQAFTLLKNWSLANPELAEARVELARLYQEQGDDDTALIHLHQALAMDPHNSRAWAASGLIREQRGEVAQAADNYRRAMNVDRRQPGVARRLATLNRQSFERGGDRRLVDERSPRRRRY